jgi:hypothetical protein
MARFLLPVERQTLGVALVVERARIIDGLQEAILAICHSPADPSIVLFQTTTAHPGNP